LLTYFKMAERRNILEEIIIPEGIEAKIEDNILKLKKGEDELKRVLNKKINIKIENNKIILEVKKTTKKEKKIFWTLYAHIKNMIKGLEEGFKYKLQIVSVHFPITASIENNEIIIKNFLGEKKERKEKIIPNVNIDINKDIIEISSKFIESAGQMAANLEKLTKIRKKDRRIFQDGIYITEKPRRKFL